MKVLAVFAFLILSEVSFSAGMKCATVRQDKIPGCMAGVPVTNQGNDPNCFTHAAALMMTGYLRGAQGQQINVAPEKIWTEIQASPPDKKSQYLSAELGRTCSGVGILKKTGTCDRKVILELLKSFSEKAFNSSEKSETKMSLLLNEIKELVNDPARIQNDKDCSRLLEGLSRMGIPKGVMSDISNILLSSGSPAEYQILDRIFKNSCQARGGWTEGTSSQEPLCKKFDFQSGKNGNKRLEEPESFKKQLHALLDQPLKQNFPIGIEYCSGVLDESGKSFITNRIFGSNIDYLNSPKADRNLDSECRFHASVIIGREQRDDGKCYFLIQNSWGASCNYYSDPSLCEGGKIWVEENDISKNLLRISHF